MRLVGHVARTGDRRNAYWGLVGKPKGKSLLGRPRRIFEDNIKIGIQEVGLGERTGLIQFRTGAGNGHL